MITLSAADGDGNVDIRGGQKTYYLAWEHGDLGDPSYQYRDAPEQKDYEWDKLAANVAGGVALSVGLGMITYGFGTLVVSGSTVAGLGISVCVGGTWYTGMQAVSDAVSGRESSSDTYLRKALAGSIVGFLSGASALASAGAGLGQTMGIAFAEGFAGDAISQHIIDGEIKWDQAIASGAFSSLMAGALWSWRNPGVKVTEGTGEAASIHPGKLAAESNDISYESIMRALRQSDTPEGYAAAALLKRGDIELRIELAHPQGWGGKYKFGTDYIIIYSSASNSPLMAAGFTVHEVKHYLQKLSPSTYAKIHEFEAYSWQRRIDKYFPLRTDKEIWDFLNSHPAYKYLKEY